MLVMLPRFAFMLVMSRRSCYYYYLQLAAMFPNGSRDMVKGNIQNGSRGKFFSLGICLDWWTRTVRTVGYASCQEIMFAWKSGHVTHKGKPDCSRAVFVASLASIGSH